MKQQPLEDVEGKYPGDQLAVYAAVQLDMLQHICTCIEGGEGLDRRGQPRHHAIRAGEPRFGANQRRAGTKLLGLGLGISPALRVGQRCLPDLHQILDLVPDRQPCPHRLVAGDLRQNLIQLLGVHTEPLGSPSASRRRAGDPQSTDIATLIPAASPYQARVLPGAKGDPLRRVDLQVKHLLRVQ